MAVQEISTGLKPPQVKDVGFTIAEDSSASLSSANNTPSSKHSQSAVGGAVPLTSSKMANLQCNTNSNNIDNKRLKDSSLAHGTDKKSSVETLLDRLNDQQLEYEDRKKAKNKPPSTTVTSAVKQTNTSYFPNSKGSVGASRTSSFHVEQFNPEVVRLKKELDAAKNKIALQDEELFKARASKDILSAQAISNMQEAYNAQRSTWPSQDDTRSDVSETFSNASFRSRSNTAFAPVTATVGAYAQDMPAPATWGQPTQRPFSNRLVQPNVQPLNIAQGIRHFGSQISPVSADSMTQPSGYGYHLACARNGGRGNQGVMHLQSGGSLSAPTSEEWSPTGFNSIYQPVGAVTPLQSPVGVLQAPTPGYQPRPIGPPLSATAADFQSAGMSPPWETRTMSPPLQNYVPMIEPLNYRRLLEKTVTCNWKYIVDKIVHNNDQQASIFLQQKLKVATTELKFEIVQAIIAQAYALMINRFGNFLIQRALEHGTPEQVIEIAKAIRGNTLRLSMDPFGCHVIQKAFDAVPEEEKATMVHELLRRIPETVVHRYACHVWQKLFELRWSDSPPQIMKYVNEALKGMWHEVALGETGSLVVQNIFENCLEEDKRPCINEVLNSIDIVAHGQFGNWCIQHICEHGAPADRTRAVDHVLKYATEYSMDQFASKVVEKCLKIGGTEFLDRYLTRVCEGRPDRPRIPLIDIASDQYGNYLIQYILTHANAAHRELVASHIRKHMVSLRGSKFGSRVGMLCSNPAYATRPTVGMGMQTQRFASNDNTFGGNTISTETTGAVSQPFPGSVSSSTSRFASNFR